jgi:hypothetical protein
MTRLERQYRRKVNSGTSGIGRQSRSEVAVLAVGRRSVDTRRSRFSAAGTGSVSGIAAERHDWLVPLELP